MADHRHILRRLGVVGDPEVVCTVCNQVFPNLQAAAVPTCAVKLPLVYAKVNAAPGPVRRFFRRLRCILFGHRGPLMDHLRLSDTTCRRSCGCCGRSWPVELRTF